MDGYLFHKSSRWQNQTLEQVKDDTKRIIGEAYKKDIKYFTILFHREEITKYLLIADIGFILLKPVPAYIYCTGENVIKLFEYMSRVYQLLFLIFQT